MLKVVRQKVGRRRKKSANFMSDDRFLSDDIVGHKNWQLLDDFYRSCDIGLTLARLVVAWCWMCGISRNAKANVYMKWV